MLGIEKLISETKDLLDCQKGEEYNQGIKDVVSMLRKNYNDHVLIWPYELTVALKELDKRSPIGTNPVDLAGELTRSIEINQGIQKA